MSGEITEDDTGTGYRMSRSSIEILSHGTMLVQSRRGMYERHLSLNPVVLRHSYMTKLYIIRNPWRPTGIPGLVSLR